MRNQSFTHPISSVCTDLSTLYSAETLLKRRILMHFYIKDTHVTHEKTLHQNRSLLSFILQRSGFLQNSRNLTGFQQICQHLCSITFAVKLQIKFSNCQL